MYIINTSFIVEGAVHGNWYEFMNTKFIPHLKTLEYENIVFTRVLSEQVEKHFTYSLQVHLDTIPDYQKYINEIMVEYVENTNPIYGTKVLYLNTLLKKVGI